MKSFILSLMLALTVTVGAFAQTIITWDMAGKAGDETFVSPTVSVDHVTGMDMIRGPGLGANVGANSFNSYGWDDLSPGTNYVEFGFTVEPGYAVRFTSISFVTRSSSSGPQTIAFVTSLRGFGDDSGPLLHHRSGITETNTIEDTHVYYPEYDAITGEFTMRLAQYSVAAANNSGLTQTSGTFRVNNIQIVGEVYQIPPTVPEPSATALLMGAIVMGLVLNKRTAKTRT